MRAHLACLLQFLLILSLCYRCYLHTVLQGGNTLNNDLVAGLQTTFDNIVLTVVVGVYGNGAILNLVVFSYDITKYLS